MSAEDESDNIAFVAYYMLNDLDSCLNLLIKRDKLAEASFFSRAYIPSKMSEVVKMWRDATSASNKKLGQSLADPEKYENLFPEFAQSLELERYQREIGYERANQLSALAPNASTCNLERNLAAEKEEAEQRGLLPAAVTHPRVPLPDNGSVIESAPADSSGIVESSKILAESLDRIDDDLEREIEDLMLDGSAGSVDLSDEADLLD